MKKRFRDTDIWDDPWYRKLLPEYKLLWAFICDKCDSSGTWKIDEESASFFLGKKIVLPTALKVFNEKKQRIIPDGDRWIIAQFVGFQFGDKLSEASPPHKTVIALLRKNGLVYNYPNVTLTLPSQYSNASPQEKEKEEEEDKDTEKEKVRVGVEVGVEVERKERYLECVDLKKGEYENLVKKFGAEQAEIWIKKLNDYVQAKGKKYKSHYHAILMWADKAGGGLPANKNGVDNWLAAQEAKEEGEKNG